MQQASAVGSDSLPSLPREKLAYVTVLDPRGALGKPGAGPDGLAVLDVDPASRTHAMLV